MTIPLTVVIPTLNEERQIATAVAALSWADEVIVADGGSADRTAELARSRGATVLEVAGTTIGGQRNAAIARARNEWVLALDADERVPDALRAEIAAVMAAPAHQAYRIRCETYFLGTARERGGWARDWHVRLFRRDRRFTADRVHEALELVADVADLRAPIRHVPYRDLSHHLEKMIVYARWGAQDLHARGRHASGWDLLGRPAWRFARDYFLYGSWRDGRYGLATSLLTACAGFLKYAFLWELDQTRDAASDSDVSQDRSAAAGRTPSS
ncbi:MAG TPA: glycosyltransferase family 2 protein [Gemmatimonadales bacterium]|nr:glycosyltransferase family 2 protein [Gemmatimonadales bacterium]